MYAIIEALGKQFKVQEKETITVNNLTGKVGDKVTFDKVLLCHDEAVEVGTPFLKGHKVHGIIKAHKKGKKVVIGKMRRRKHYQKITGHRDSLSEITIEKIEK